MSYIHLFESKIWLRGEKCFGWIIRLLCVSDGIEDGLQKEGKLGGKKMKILIYMLILTP